MNKHLQKESAIYKRPITVYMFHKMRTYTKRWAFYKQDNEL